MNHTPNHTPNHEMTSSEPMQVTIKGARQLGAPGARPSGAGSSAPSPHGQHRQEFPVDPLPDPSLRFESHDEPAWRGATRMLAALAAARRVHPAGSARAS